MITMESARIRACDNKKTFPTREAAEKDAERLGLSVYECAFCGQFHRTSQKGIVSPFLKNRDHYGDKCEQ